jgi:hypothetical protein
MANRTTVKIGPAINAKLYKEFVAVAKENGQSQRFLLEKAIEHYIHNVVPSQRTVRPEVIKRSAARTKNSGTCIGSWPSKWRNGSA